jgi:hypothetical protein
MTSMELDLAKALGLTGYALSFVTVLAVILM